MPQNNEYMLKQDDAELIYQKKLTAGTNITIDPITNTISSTGGGGSSVSYSGSLPQGYGDTIGIITIDGTQYPIKVRNLIQGSNINIVQDMATGNLTISSTAQGTHVEANPSDPATARLSTIEIGSIVYDTTYDVFEAPETAQDAGINGLVPAPTYADVQANKVLQADGTWVPQSGGGGGNVADVYVNGTSVLDENDIAQVFSHEEITESNYDNLPSTKFSDNHMYLIKEAGTPPTGEYFNPIIYSTEERVVGVWINNKPLYQKTCVFGSVSGQTANLSLGIANIEEAFLCADASYVNNGDCPLPYVTGTAYANNIGGFFDIGVSDTSFAIRIGQSMAGSVNNVVLTVRYTKTTDVAGSGKYNTLGVPNVHYTTDEQVIGTWIDGKPLYQKTYSITEITVRPTETLVPSFDISSMDRIINAVGTHTQYQQSAPLLAFIDSNQFYLSTSLACMIDTITLQYTKTTD